MEHVHMLWQRYQALEDVDGRQEKVKATTMEKIEEKVENEIDQLYEEIFEISDEEKLYCVVS
jgi:hypothetical protein